MGEPLEVPFIHKIVKKRCKNEVEERREQLLSLIKKTGLRNARKSIKALAEHYKVTASQLYKDFDWIKGHYRPAEMQEIKMALGIARDNALDEALNLLANATTNEDKHKAIQTIISMSKHYREELEAWGIKPKVADRLEIQEETSLRKEYAKELEEFSNLNDKEKEAVKRVLFGNYEKKK